MGYRGILKEVCHSWPGVELEEGLPGKGNCMCKGPEVRECVLLWRNNGKASEFGAWRIKGTE